MKAHKIKLTNGEVEDFEALRPLPGQAWKFWKSIFQSRNIEINGSDKAIPCVEGTATRGLFRLTVSGRKVPQHGRKDRTRR